MITIEIKANGVIKEVISVRRMDDDSSVNVTVIKDKKVVSKEYWETTNMYLVNEVYRIWHKRIDGHRELARKALMAVRRSK